MPCSHSFQSLLHWCAGGLKLSKLLKFLTLSLSHLMSSNNVLYFQFLTETFYKVILPLLQYLPAPMNQITSPFFQLLVQMVLTTTCPVTCGVLLSHVPLCLSVITFYTSSWIFLVLFVSTLIFFIRPCFLEKPLCLLFHSMTERICSLPTGPILSFSRTNPVFVTDTIRQPAQTTGRRLRLDNRKGCRER